MGEVLLLQEHRGAGGVHRASSHLSSDGGAGGRTAGGLQEQESRGKEERRGSNSIFVCGDKV